LYRSIERLKSDPAYIESIARKELGMIRKEEIIIKPGNRDKKE
jgi:cell division protein FtsB